MPDIKEKLVALICRMPELLQGCDYPTGECTRCNKLADHLIANGVTIQKWISVEERLPEYGEKVLVCDTREDYVGVSVLQKGFDFGGEKDPDYWCWMDDCFNLDEFTHWMPLPEPPKGE